MEFVTERLILRPWKDTDAESLYEYAKDPEVGPIAGWPVHTSVENSLWVIQNVLSADETYAVCLKIADETDPKNYTEGPAIGSIGLISPMQSHTKAGEDELEVGYWIGKPYWGKGLIPEAVDCLLEYAFTKRNTSAMWCGYYEGNTKSKRVQEKCGFVYHHTETDKPCPAMGDIRTEHFTYLTKAQWEMRKRFLYSVPDYKKIRVIVDTDAACEADDPFAIVHALLSPKAMVRGIVAEHFNEEGSVEKSLKEIHTILDAMGLFCPSFLGQKGALAKDETVSDGVRFLISEAMREDERPLYVLCQGAITNVAKALRVCPEIKEKMTVIWIGTHGIAPKEAPFREFNAGNDVEAANEVLRSGIDLWLVPSNVYTTILIGIAELQRRVRPLGKIGEHLFSQLVNYNLSEFAGWTQGESWSLGDSPAIAIALNPGCGHYVYTKAPYVGEDTSSLASEDMPVIRVYTDVDSRYILEDMISKLEIFAGM